MSRSRRHTSIYGNLKAKTESADKIVWHQRLRSRSRDQLINYSLGEDLIPISQKVVSSPWKMTKDGKRWLSDELKKRIATLASEAKMRPEPERGKLIKRYLSKINNK